MSETRTPYVPDFEDEEDYDDDGYCFWCGGDGFTESDDPMWDLSDWVRCSSCGGSGKAEDMTIW